jgi:hypothetical protein
MPIHIQDFYVSFPAPTAQARRLMIAFLVTQEDFTETLLFKIFQGIQESGPCPSGLIAPSPPADHHKVDLQVMLLDALLKQRKDVFFESVVII